MQRAVMWSGFLHFLGIEPRQTSTAYNFWSGFGSDISEVAIVGALLGMVRTHNCHVKGCWRIGKHLTADGLYKLCSTHHPDTPNRVTADAVAQGRQ